KTTRGGAAGRYDRHRPVSLHSAMAYLLNRRDPTATESAQLKKQLMNPIAPPSIFIALFAITVGLRSAHCDAAVEDNAASLINFAKQKAPVQQGYTLHRLQQKEKVVCSCSPQSYTFQIILDKDCSTSTLSVDDANGISDLSCQISSLTEDVRRVRLVNDLLSQVQNILPTTMQLPNDRRSPTQISNMTVAFISSVLFIEFDTSGTLNLINEDPTYFADSNITEGMMFTYPSISQSLNTSLGLDEQLQYVPGGGGLFMFASNKEGEVILSNRVVWEFSGACDVAVEIEGKNLGWIGFEETSPAKPEFCPVSISSPPTITMGTRTPSTLAPPPPSDSSNQSTAPSLVPVAEFPTSVTKSPISKSSKQTTAKSSKLFGHSKSSKNDEKSTESESSTKKKGTTMSLQAKHAKRLFSKKKPY
ncbi:hypothetical protein ACHAXA_000773, partial [Cyclostephanos tholiformis]